MLRALSAEGWSHTPRYPRVEITSIVTETVHPTITLTEVLTVGVTRAQTSSPTSPNAGPSSQPPPSPQSEVTGRQTQSELGSANADQTPTWSSDALMPSQLTTWLPVSTLSPVTLTLPTSTTRLSEDLVKPSAVLPVSVASSATFSAPTSMGGSSQTSSVGADAASSAQPSPSTWLTLSHAPATTMMTTTSISSSHLIYPSLSPSSATASSTGIASDASSLDSQLSHGRPSLSTGAIVGCVVGGVIGLGLVILACLFCLRRKGIQVLSSLGMNSRRKSDDSLTTLHAMRDSEAFPMGAVLAPRAANMVPSHATTPRPVVAEPVKQEPTTDTRGLAQKFHAKHGALSARCSVTPLIQVQPCSRAPSTLSHLSSQQSAETKLDYMEQAEFGTAPSATSDYESVDDPEKSVMMVDFSNFPEDNRLAPRRDYDMRLSTRSDPFDLELPLKSLGCHARLFQQGPETGHF